MNDQDTGWRGRLTGVAQAGALLASVLVASCTAQPTAQSSGYGAIGTDAETLEQRVARLERDLAEMRIDYSVVRPAMERLTSDERGLEARLDAIESAFGPITASISPAETQTPAYQVPATGGFPAFGLHLASYRDLENVNRGWRELQSAHSDLLSGLELKVTEFRSRHDGVYKRLVAGPVDPATAESLCMSLKDRGVWCQAVELGQ